MHNQLLYILHAAQAVEAEGTNQHTKAFFIHEVIATVVDLLSAIEQGADHG